MKRNILLIVVAATVLASCSNNDTLKQDVSSEKIPFSFSAYSSKSTKTDIHSNLDFFYKTFKVYGWKKVNGTWNTTTPVFDNVTNEYFASNSVYGNSIYLEAGGVKPVDEWGTIQSFPAWFYEDIRYWDKFASDYQFCAYTPITASESVACNHLGVITIGKTTPVTVDTKNLMATPETELAYTGFDYDYMTATSVAKTSAVSLVFSHELAKFNIKLLLDNSITTKQDVVVNEVSLLNLNGTSTYESDKESATGYLSGWKTPTTEVEYKANGVGTATTGYKMNGTTAGTDKFDGYFVMERLMIPQSTTKTNVDCQITEFDEACVYVKYTIGAEPFEGYYSLANLFLGTDTASKYDFEGGNEYTLIITVGPKPIYFTTSVNTWTNHDAALAAD